MKPETLKDKLWRIYTGDYTDIGYRVGVEQARMGKPKSFFGKVTKINVINQLWQANHAQTTFGTGLNKGYDDKLTAQTLYAQFTPSPQGAGMSNLENYNHILESLRTAETDIRLTISQLESSLAHYSSQLSALKGMGLLDDYTDPIKAENGLKIRIEDLQDILKKILLHIDDIEQKIQALKADAQNTP